MAEAEGAGTASPPGSIRLPFVVMAVLILLFVVGGIVFKKEKPKPFKTEGSRAVVLPAADRTRMVVVPPCSPPTVITPQNASTQIAVPGSVAVSIPRGAPARTVVIPRCSARAAPSPGAPNIPSGAFVLGPDRTVSDQSKVPKGGDPVAYGIKTQVQVPAGSPVKAVVAAPCQGKAGVERIRILKPTRGAGGIAIAPKC